MLKIQTEKKGNTEHIGVDEMHNNYYVFVKVFDCEIRKLTFPLEEAILLFPTLGESR